MANKRRIVNPYFAGASVHVVDVHTSLEFFTSNESISAPPKKYKVAIRRVLEREGR